MPLLSGTVSIHTLRTFPLGHFPYDNFHGHIPLLLLNYRSVRCIVYGMTHWSRGTEVIIGVKFGIESVVYRVSLSFLRVGYGQGQVNVVSRKVRHSSIT